MNDKKQLLIIWFSRTGGSEALAKAAYNGALQEPDCDVVMVPADKANAAMMLAADGYIFAFPENLAAIAGGMKEFFDRTYYDVLGQIEGRAYAMMICAGSDGENAMRQGERICTGWRLKKIADTQIVMTGAQDKEAIMAAKTLPENALTTAHETGQAMAAGLAMGMW